MREMLFMNEPGCTLVYADTSVCKIMLPKRRFWKAEQKMKSGFSTDFSMVRSPNRVLTPLKSASFENLDFIFCSSFQNLRLGGIKMWHVRAAAHGTTHLPKMPGRTQDNLTVEVTEHIELAPVNDIKRINSP